MRTLMSQVMDQEILETIDAYQLDVNLISNQI